MVTLMNASTIRATPDSDPQRPQSTRPGPLQTGRASDTGVSFVDFTIAHAKPHGFIDKLCLEVGPTGIIDGFGEARLDQLRTGDIPDHSQKAEIIRSQILSQPASVAILKSKVNDRRLKATACEEGGNVSVD